MNDGVYSVKLSDVFAMIEKSANSQKVKTEDEYIAWNPYKGETVHISCDVKYENGEGIFHWKVER